MDVLDYDYDSGNKLLKVTDTGNKAHGFKDGTNTNNDFEYDANGNLKIDRNKGITGITYNHLNLPTGVTINNGTDNGIITYIYDAAGAKLQKIVVDNNTSSTTTTDYAGNFIYENSSLKFFNQGEGYVEPINPSNYSTGFNYIYQYKDHLGNVRLSYKNIGTTGSPNLEILEENNYYPFGLKHKGYNSNINGVENNYQTYNGKELEKELNLGWIDYGARRYQPDLGRWMNVDPAAHEYVGISPYSYTANNPIVFIDPDGKRLFFVGGANNDQDGWEYITRWGNYMTDAGIRNFVRVNASTGKLGDVMFTNTFRSDPTFRRVSGISGIPYGGVTCTEGRAQHESIDAAYDQIKSNIKENALEEGEQFNLVGYSFGSILQAQVALRLADEGTYIDNLVLIGSPISSNSKLFKALEKNENIGKVTRVDIEGDLLSDPKDVLEFIQGGKQNSSDDGPHFDLARPSDEANSLIQTVIKWLQDQGVE